MTDVLDRPSSARNDDGAAATAATTPTLAVTPDYPIQAQPAPRMSTRAKLVLFLLCAANFMVAVDFSILNIAVPSIGKDLGISEANLQWVSTAFALPSGGFLLLSGRIGDLAVIAQARLYEVDDAFYQKLKKVKRLPLEEAERQHILRVLRQTKWRIAGPRGAAVLLGMKRTTLQARIRKLGIRRPI